MLPFLPWRSGPLGRLQRTCAERISDALPHPRHVFAFV